MDPHELLLMADSDRPCLENELVDVWREDWPLSACWCLAKGDVVVGRGLHPSTVASVVSSFCCCHGNECVVGVGTKAETLLEE